MNLPQIVISKNKDKASSNKGSAESLVMAFFSGDSVPKDKKEDNVKVGPVYVGDKAKELAPLFERLKQSNHFTGKKNETSLLRYFSVLGYSNVLLLGFGSKKLWEPELSRQAGAALYLCQKREKIKSADFVYDFNKSAESFYAFCEGYYLASYDYLDLKKEDKNIFYPESLTFCGSLPAAFEKLAERAKLVSLAVFFSRSLGDKPANYLTPVEFGNLVQSMSKTRSLACKLLGPKEIEKEKMGLLLGVSQGSSEEPRFIIVEYKGGKKGDKPIALIGKGVTFDSGGISLKPADHMEDMKYDMMGAAAVAGIMQAVADLKIPLNITGYIAASENMPGGRAQKPGDVKRSITGKTVEIINTDAEGRLVLADAIEYAQKSEPQAIIDFATLTGAVVVALGGIAVGIFGNSKDLLDRFRKSSTETGEKVWELPLYPEYEEDLKSHCADIKNSGVRDAGASKGATFLKFFVDSKIPWVHCDIAGAAYHRRDVNYHPSKLGSGVMVRLMVDLLSNWKTLKSN